MLPACAPVVQKEDYRAQKNDRYDDNYPNDDRVVFAAGAATSYSFSRVDGQTVNARCCIVFRIGIEKGLPKWS